jgi:ABC-type multidrug transport system fused ATPase/permease subunit
MDKGRIVEKGNHPELMAVSDGLYRKLYEELAGIEASEEESHGEES